MPSQWNNWPSTVRAYYVISSGTGLVRVAGNCRWFCWVEKRFSQLGSYDVPRHPSRGSTEGTNSSLTERKCAESSFRLIHMMTKEGNKKDWVGSLAAYKWSTNNSYVMSGSCMDSYSFSFTRWFSPYPPVFQYFKFSKTYTRFKKPVF